MSSLDVSFRRPLRPELTESGTRRKLCAVESAAPKSMTCEVLVMNRKAAVLAADSATTVQSGRGDERRPRFAKGGNKIFQVSDFEPVAAMIYQGAGLQGMPWEIVIKRFRGDLARRSEPTLKDYADRFFEFVRNDTKLFPESFRDDVYASLLESGFLHSLAELNKAQPKAFDSAVPEADRKQLWSDFLSKKQADVTKGSLPPGFVEQDVVETRSRVVPKLLTDIEQVLKELKAENVVSAAELAELSLIRTFRDFETLLSGEYTGIVFAGYGDDDFFPAYQEYSCFGFIARKLVVLKRGAEAIDVRKNLSVIEGFATTSMVEQFIQGMNFDHYATTLVHFHHHARALCEDLFKELKVAPIDISKLIKDRQEAFRKDWQRAVYTEHWAPLSEVVSTLGIEEMAELAETLVMLESLKERVTSPDQSVGGPIDVAVISKSEGFVWIKRKLYFDGKLNDRYFLRLREKFGGKAGNK
jgi:hypothetical protein